MYPQKFLAKKIIALYLFAVLVLFGLMFLLNNSFVFIESSQPEKDVSLSLKRAGDESSRAAKPGLNILKKGSYILDAEKDTRLTRLSFATKHFRIQTVRYDLKQQQEVYKVASAAKSCLAGSLASIRQGFVLSHDCVAAASLSKSVYQQNIIDEQVALSTNLFSIQSYRDGVLGIKMREEDTGEVGLLFANISSQKIVPLGNSLRSDNPENYQILVDGESLVILDIEQKRAMYFDSFDAPPTIVGLNIPDGMWTSNIVAKYSGEKLYLLAASNTAHKEEIESFDDGNLMIFNKRQSSPSSIVNVKEYIEELSDFIVLNEQTLVGIDLGQNLSVFSLSEELIKQSTIPGVLRAEPLNNKLYVLMTNGFVYEYDIADKISYLVYGSTKTKIASLQKLHNRLILSGYAEASSDFPVSLSFLLEDSPLNEKRRAQDFLPYSYTYNRLPIVSMDYLGFDIKISLALETLQTNKQTGQTTFDQTEFNTAKEKVMKALLDDGLDMNKYKVEFVAS